jgi:hypothetical protein
MNTIRFRASTLATLFASFIPQVALARPLSPSVVLNADAASDIGDDDAPAVAMDAMGRAIVVWTSTGAAGGSFGTDSDILFATSIDHGLTWSTPQPIDPGAASDSAEDRAPFISTDAGGRWVVVWQSQIGRDFDIRMARSLDDGNTWTPPVALNADADGDAGDDLAPRLATDRKGRWIAVWSADEGPGSDAEILAAISIDDAATFGAPVPLSNNRAEDRHPVIASNEVGQWIAAWESNDALDETIGSDFDIVTSRSSDGGATWNSPERLNANAAFDTGDDAKVDLAGDGTGHWIAVWHSDEPLPWGPDTDILMARSANNGASWSSPTELYSFALIELGNEYDPRVLTDGAGDWWVVWTRVDSVTGSSNEDGDILQARSTNFGITWTGPELINEDAITDVGDDFRPSPAASRNGDWLVAWASTGGTLGADGDLLVATQFDGCVTDADCDDGDACTADSCNARGTCIRSELPECEPPLDPRPDPVGESVSFDEPFDEATPASNEADDFVAAVSVPADEGFDEVTPASNQADDFVVDDDGCECNATREDRSAPIALLLVGCLWFTRRGPSLRSRSPRGGR